MTFDGWRECVLEAVRRHEAGDSKLLDLTAQVLVEQDVAKQALRDKGYGWIGLGLPETVAEVEAIG